jgi:HAD superfamily hydrolase (TIGR01509 family)
VRRRGAEGAGTDVIIFDCNGVLVDSELIAASVTADELTRAGVPISSELVMRYFFGRRPADIIAAVEATTRRRLPANFETTVARATLKRLRTELRAVPHAAHALTWLRGPKCVASSSPRDRIFASLEATDLLRFFDSHLFSASDVAVGKPAPDLFLHAASRMKVAPARCIVVEDSPVGVAAAAAAGMSAVGFVGGSHAGANFGQDLMAAGARAIVADMRHLKGTIVSLRGF